MAPQVHILTCCRGSEGLFGNLLTFESLRTGFPTAKVTVWDNASDFGHERIVDAALGAGAWRVFSLEHRIEHGQWIEARVNEADGPIVIVDPDVIFWESVEGWDFAGKLMAGRLMPEHRTRPDWVSAPRLHTSLLFIPDPQRLRETIAAHKAGLWCFRPWQDVQVPEPGGVVRYIDVGAALYGAIRNECFAFGEDQLNAYDHLFCGTCPDLVDRFSWPARLLELRQAAERDRSLVRGCWREQEAFLQGVSREGAKALEWTCGNYDAAEFLMLLFGISQEVDDLVDGDCEDTSGALAKIFVATLGSLRPNAFFCRYEAELVALMTSSFLLWDSSNTWAKAEKLESRMFAFVYREILEQIVSWVAYVTGGIDHGRRVAIDVHNFYHVRRGESFERWSAEQKAKEPSNVQ